MALTATIKSKIGTTDEWDANFQDEDGSLHKRILKRGEIGIEITDDNKMLCKVGDGNRPYDQLPYINGFDQLSEDIQKARDVIASSLTPATTTTDGLMSAKDKQKLNSLFNTVIDGAIYSTSENPVQNKVIYDEIQRIDYDISTKVNRTLRINGYPLTDDIDLNEYDLGINVEKSMEDTLSSANKYTDDNITTTNTRIDNEVSTLNNTINQNKDSLDSDISNLTNDVNTKYDTLSTNISDLDTKLTTKINNDISTTTIDLKKYTDDAIDTLTGEGVKETLDTLKEIGDYIEENRADIDTLNNIANSNKQELQGNIDNTNVNLDNLTTTVTNNKTASDDADKTLQDNIDALTQTVSDDKAYIEDYYFPKGTIVLDRDTDWNTVIEAGCYKVQDQTMDLIHNTPILEYNIGLLHVERLVTGKDVSNRIVQIYYPHIPSKAAIWVRVSNELTNDGKSGNFQSWKRMVDATQAVTNISISDSTITYKMVDGTTDSFNIPVYTELKNPYALTITLNGGTTTDTDIFVYDGSSVKSINITPSSINASASDHNHTGVYMPINWSNNTLYKVGDDVSIGDGNVAGSLVIQGINDETGIYLKSTKSDGTDQKISIDGSGTMTITGTLTSSFLGDLSGNATTATSTPLLSPDDTLYSNNGIGGLNYFNINTSTTSGGEANAVPISDKSYHIIRMNNKDSNGYFTDLAFPLNNETTVSAWRKISAKTDNGWNYLFDTNSFNIIDNKIQIKNSDQALKEYTLFNSGSGISVSSNNENGVASTISLTAINNNDSNTTVKNKTDDYDNLSPEFGGTFYIPNITYDQFGRTNSSSYETITLPSYVATTTKAGLMSATDKANLDNMKLGSGLPIASATSLGAIKVGTNLNISTEGVLNAVDTTYPLYFKTIDANFSSSIRTECTGSSNSGSFISVIRANSTTNDTELPIYGSGIAFGMNDTHTYLITSWSEEAAYIGAGNGDTLRWKKQISFSDHTHNYAGSSSAGGSATSAVTLDGFTDVTSSGISDLTDSNTTITNGTLVKRLKDSSSSKGDLIVTVNSNTNTMMISTNGYFFQNNKYLCLDTNNYKTYCTPANIGAATSTHTHTTYGTTVGFDSSTSVLSLKNSSGSTLSSTTINNGYPYIGTSAPSNTNLLWIDTGNNGLLKYYNGSEWTEVRTRGVWS